MPCASNIASTSGLRWTGAAQIAYAATKAGVIQMTRSIAVQAIMIAALLLGALRFMLAAFPALLFLKPPKVPLRLYLAYGLTISVGQFAFLFSAIHVGMPSGLASLVLQSQSFFTLLLAAYVLSLGDSHGNTGSAGDGAASE